VLVRPFNPSRSCRRPALTRLFDAAEKSPHTRVTILTRRSVPSMPP